MLETKNALCNEYLRSKHFFACAADFGAGWEARNDEIALLENNLKIAVEALNWLQIHLASMENYSLVTGALHHIETELEKIK